MGGNYIGLISRMSLPIIRARNCDSTTSMPIEATLGVPVMREQPHWYKACIMLHGYLQESTPDVRSLDLHL